MAFLDYSNELIAEAFPSASPGGTFGYTTSTDTSKSWEEWQKYYDLDYALSQPGTTFEEGQMTQDYIDWMTGEGASEFEGWSDSQKQAWLDQIIAGDTTGASATQWWTDYGLSVEEANQRTEEDRNTMLGALAEYKTAYGTNWVETLLAEERANLNAAMNASLQSIQQQFASMGRVADPFVMGYMQSQLAIAAEQQYATRQAELETQKVEYEQKYLDLLYQTLSETQYDVPSLTEALAVLEALGTSAAS